MKYNLKLIQKFKFNFFIVRNFRHNVLYNIRIFDLINKVYGSIIYNHQFYLLRMREI